MRLWFSVAVLLVLTCVVLEISAAKSKREADVSRAKSNSKSTEANKEVRYSKNKSDHKKKGKGKEQEVGKDKKRRGVDGSENVDGVEVSKKNKKERDVKLNQEEQKRSESNKHEKIDKNQKTYKKEKTIVKVDEEVGKRHKRSVESDEQPEETVTDRSTRKEEPRSNPASKSKSVKKSKKEGDATDGSIKDEPKSDIMSENPETEEKIVGENKRVKKVKHCKNNEETVKTKKSEKIRTSDQRIKEPGNSKYLNDTPEKSYYLNEDGLIKEKQSGSGKRDEKHKYPRKSSEFVPACRREAGDESFPEQKAQPHEFDNCKVDAKCSPDKNTENYEKSKYFADEVGQLDENQEFETEEESTEES